MKHYKFKALLFGTVILLCAFIISGCSALKNSENSYNEKESSNSPTASPSQTKPRTKINTGYGFKSLDSEDKQRLYSLIDEYANKSESEDFSLGGEYSEKTISQVLLAYKNDHPQTFWINDTFEYYVYDSETVLTLKFTSENSELINRREELEKIVDNIVSDAPKNANDYEVELFINDYLVDNCEYDNDGALAADNGKALGNEHNAYGALIDKKAVCDGYSKAFQLLCNRLGIDCVVIQGMSKGDHHMWNCINIENEWYHADITWNDSNTYTYSERYFYLNLTTEEIKVDHTISETYDEINSDNYDDTMLYNCFVPECTSTEYNYFYNNCPVMSDPDNCENIIKALTASAEEYDDNFEFVIDQSLDYDKTFNNLANDGYIYSWIEKANSDNENLPCISTKSELYGYAERKLVIIKLEYL